ncbi:MAG TPA: hypothetical protein VMW77_07680 [Methanoregula sp.]|nr:hypothetical protein [Methanoregula sp.]
MRISSATVAALLSKKKEMRLLNNPIFHLSPTFLLLHNQPPLVHSGSLSLLSLMSLLLRNRPHSRHP